MRDNGYTVQVNDDSERSAIRKQNNVPFQIQSCHTAIVDGYIIEGHVPVVEIERLLTERPEIVGLAVVGMPAGSPGMDDLSLNQASFDVISFDKSGNTKIFASYPK
jgi:hypothetical protein